MSNSSEDNNGNCWNYYKKLEAETRFPNMDNFVVYSQKVVRVHMTKTQCLHV